MLTPIYTSFAHASNTLHNVQAVDYFLAKELSESLFSNTDIGEECSVKDNHVQHALFFHLVVALSQHVFDGHTCLPIASIANTCLGFESDKDGVILKQGYNFPDKNTITAFIEQLPLAYSDEQLLVYKEQCLYLRRYAVFENELTHQLSQRITINHAFDTASISRVIAELFPGETDVDHSSKEEQVVDWQKVAVANALNKNFSVIAGGPGTGKTYTVTKLLAALVMLNKQANLNNSSPQAIRFALAAPTGKAAQRLSESITQAVKQFSGIIDAHILNEIPVQALTIHRLLGYIPNSPNFRYNEKNILPVDFLLIDEASMVDLALLTRIFRALPAHTKVVLLGDADQLPSVAVGNVLADIAPRPHRGYSKENTRYLNEVTQYKSPTNNQLATDYLTFLQKSRRFDGQGGIGLLAKAVIAGDAFTSWQLLKHRAEHLDSAKIEAELTLLPQQESMAYGSNKKEQGLLHSQTFYQFVDTYYSPIFQCNTPKEAFSILHQFRILCATKVGQEGVEAINENIIQYFQHQGLLSSVYKIGNTNTSISVLPNIYHAMPILILENHHKLGIYNGDIGMIWKDSEGQLMAVFESENTDEHPDGIYCITPSRLPKFQPVYAMTIHKTQGSEFSKVLMVLPQQRDNKLLSRELLYTGITRAKKHITIASTQHVWLRAVETKVTRFSNLTLTNKT